MAAGVGGDLEVDVLVIGGGIFGLYLARALHPDHVVCVVCEPEVPIEALDASGWFSAGYDGDDVARIQPARRAAGYWRLWAESNGVPHTIDPWIVMPPEDEGRRTRLWRDALLASRPEVGRPAGMDGSVLDGLVAYRAENDVVMNPAAVMDELRRGIEDQVIAAEVVRMALVTDDAIDFVEVQLDDGSSVAITPAYVVLAADVANGSLLQRFVTGFKDRTKRKQAIDHMHTCQAVRRRLTIAIRGDLPIMAGVFDGIEVVSHDHADGWEMVWLVAPPIDDTATVLGPEDLRFAPKVDREVVRDTLGKLFAMAPEVGSRADELQWAAYVARQTEHPMMAVPDTSVIAQPSPARLETFDVEGFVAGWPSHLPFAMIVGDVVAERIRSALGESHGSRPVDGPRPVDLPHPDPESLLARWERADFPWQDWSDFRKDVGYAP
jgi:glycine/D-amino acid oxidase-like deaminating enzyme